MTSAAAIEISVCNDALALVGHPAIHDFDGDTPASETAKRLYELALGQLLDAYDWRFAMRQRQLARNTDAPLAKYAYSHKLPTDRDGIPARFYSDASGTPITDSAIYTDDVHSDSEIVYCDYVRNGGLTGNFRNLLVRALAADFALSIYDDRGMHDRFYAQAFGTPREGGRGGLMKTAMSHDARGAEPRNVLKIGLGPLVEAHGGYRDDREYDILRRMPR